MTRLLDDCERNKQQKESQQNSQKLRDADMRLKFDFSKYPDVLKDAAKSLESLAIGTIVDAKDEYDNWHLAIIFDEKVGSSKSNANKVI